MGGRLGRGGGKSIRLQHRRRVPLHVVCQPQPFQLVASNARAFPKDRRRHFCRRLQFKQPFAVPLGHPAALNTRSSSNS